VTEWRPLEVDEVAVNQSFALVDHDAQDDRHVGTLCKVLFPGCGCGDYRRIPRRACPAHQFYAQPLTGASHSDVDPSQNRIRIGSMLSESDAAGVAADLFVKGHRPGLGCHVELGTENLLAQSILA